MVVKNCSNCDYCGKDSECIVPESDRRFLCPYELFTFMFKTFSFLAVSGLFVGKSSNDDNRPYCCPDDDFDDFFEDGERSDV